MNQSFTLTTAQMYACTKDVTRRNGRVAKVGETVQAIEKGQGIPRGQHIKIIGQILYLSVRDEPLRRMLDDLEYGRAECIREGFPDTKPHEFVTMYCLANKCTPEQIVHRVEFKHLYEPHQPERSVTNEVSIMQN